MTRVIATWSAVPVAAFALLIAMFAARQGVIESITVAALVTICWSFVIRIAGSLAGEEGGPDGTGD